MQKIWQWVLLLFAGIIFINFSPPLTSHAREVTEAVGLDANSAIIKDDKGKVYSHTEQLPEANHYTVNYKWRIPDSAKVRSGDTMTCYVPSNVHVTEDQSFPIVGNLGGSLGTFFIAKGATTGTMTLNRALQIATLSRKGYLNFDVYGNVPAKPTLPTPPPAPAPTAPLELHKAAAWTDVSDQTKINWSVDLTSNGHRLLDPNFTDKLSSNQTYVENSAKLTDDLGNNVPVSVETAGTEIYFTIKGSYQSNLHLTYQTTTDNPNNTDTFSNSIHYTDSNGNSANAATSIHREGSDDVDEPEPPVTEPGEPEPEDPEPEEPGTTSPVDPEAPGEPTPTEPEKPGTTNPVDPEAPGEPAPTEPEKPGTTHPVDPEVPGEPAPTEPGKPGTTNPVDPEVPSQPAPTEPEKPSTTDPAKPDVTEMADSEEAGNSGSGKPGTTNHNDVLKPSGSDSKPATLPEVPGIPMPDTPGKPNLATPHRPTITAGRGDVVTGNDVFTVVNQAKTTLGQLFAMAKGDQTPQSYQQTANTNAKQPAEQLPQTGEQRQQTLMIIGVIGLVLLALIGGIVTRRKKS
ncbi:LPXTG cell wall anchor domain-containing protein [Lactiplantibacillus garii]|uniref:LPXTG cell wall anchor domain-containing protein n=1 Tax=Lactiplantibacillus garii TaxID=2306423 RepID=A0A426D6S9_9LACO|nr:LPXTG cell wall anchor domain-containing protein [Lactiplantibacillus garii]RRK10333.1 LPXTG cell wall anchor domain-containing protein [Lactiplantibacillus garii]